MKLQELLRTDANVVVRRGWDFSHIRDERAATPWDYSDVIRRYLDKTKQVLDIGTGGGEFFLSLAPHFDTGIGIDLSPAMIATARQNAASQNTKNVSFLVMNAHALGVLANTTDLVLNRQSVIHVQEVVRVLSPGSYFITQQVGPRNTANILTAFGWDAASFGIGWWEPVTTLAEQFQQSGCRIVAIAEYDVPYWFCDVESLVFWLKTIPLPETFRMTEHWQGVNRILSTHLSDRGIKTNEHRELLIVQKRND